MIEWKGQWAVKKTFKEGRDRFLAREKFVYGQLSKKHPAIPPLLESGGDYIIIPWYRGAVRINSGFRKQILKFCARDVIRVMKFFYDQGFAIVNFHP